MCMPGRLIPQSSEHNPSAINQLGIANLESIQQSGEVGLSDERWCLVKSVLLNEGQYCDTVCLCAMLELRY